MRHSCRRMVLTLLAVVIGAALPIPTHAGAQRSADVKITNRTDWVIDELYLSSADDDNWGPDQLGEPGEQCPVRQVRGRWPWPPRSRLP